MNKPKLIIPAIGCGLLIAAIIELVVMRRENLSPIWKNYGKNTFFPVAYPAENILTEISEVDDLKILCIIQTATKFHDIRLMSVYGTWAKLCDDFFAATSVDNPTLRMVDMHVGDSKRNNWGRMRAAMVYTYNNKDWKRFDWIIKADDDVYIVMRNLRKFLGSKDPNSKVYYGARFHVGWEKHRVKYMSGACYAISRAAFAAMMSGPIDSNELCYANRTTGHEDLMMGVCMEKSGVEWGDGRDPDGRWKFFPDKTEYFLMPPRRGGMTKRHWLYSYVKDTLISGSWNCCSREPIQFHYITPVMMYTLHFVYRAFDEERFVPPPEMERAIQEGL